jgi:flagellar assembly protein FliH
MNQSTATFDLEPYRYPGETATAASCEDWLLTEVDGRGNPILRQPEEEAGPDLDPALLEEQIRARLAEDALRSFETGYQKGREDSLSEEREAEQAARAAKLQDLATAVGNMAEGFAAERSRYYERLEQETVRLAIAIAGRILRREAQMDPLFLIGAVRVALGQLTGSTRVRLRVPSADAELWSEAMALLPNRETKPELIAAEQMRTGDCLMETELGSADLGVRAQLGEIERALLERGAEAQDSDAAMAGAQR